MRVSRLVLVCLMVFGAVMTGAALAQEGYPLKGTWLGVKRILRCQPFCEGGHDPVV